MSDLQKLSNAIRALSMDAVEKAQSGHPGMPMGMADVATVLFSKFLKFNPSDPTWPDRDRFVLSAGHGSMLLYSLAYLTGYQHMRIDDIKAFRQLGAKTAGHPEYEPDVGIETTTGPLGQGFGNAVGMALAERGLRARFGDDLCHHKTYVMVGDGCLMEGIAQESLSFAGHQKLNHLIVLFDDNGITIDGKTDLSTSEDHIKRFEANGWVTDTIDGHDYDAIETALKKAQTSNAPVFIACKTTIGYGAPTKQGSAKVHGAPLGEGEIQGARDRLNWPYPPFEVPEDILDAWRGLWHRNQEAYQQWQENLQQKTAEEKAAYQQYTAKSAPDIEDAVQTFCESIAQEKPCVATRKSSERVISFLHAALPNLLGGSADLTGSNNTKGLEMAPVMPDTPEGSYVYYGIREHGMGAMMNGVALHGGYIPFGGTFLVFSDYCRPSIRLSALMEQRVIYVMTHDSIGLGEDGPTHQPIEHLWSLRMIPNLNVFRPADTIETAECWAAALTHLSTPSVLALTRQSLPTVRTSAAENLSAKGGYVLKECDGADVTFVATGSEVALALETADLCQQKGLKARVVSMPCVDLFLKQPMAYQNKVLGSLPRVSIEAGRTDPWYRIVGDRGLTIGIDTFGASAPLADLLEHFGLTAEKIYQKVKQHLEKKV